MAAKQAHDAARAKAAKEKKVLLALAPLLAIAVFFAYHTLSKLHSPAGPTATPVAATTSASPVSAATTTPATSTPPATGTPVAAPVATPTDGTLTRFTLFSAKDPFHDHGPHTATSGSGSPSSSAPAKKSKPSKQAKQKKSKPARKTPPPPPTSAVIEVNHKLFDVAVGETIPLDAAFGAYLKLKALTRRTATLGLPGQKRPLRLTVGRSVKLTDQAGHTYVIVLFPQGTVLPGAPATTTPTTTTTGP